METDIATVYWVKSINRDEVSTEQTRADESTSTAPAMMIHSIPQAVIFGAVGGALAVGVITLAALVLVVVVITNKKKRMKDGSAAVNGKNIQHCYDIMKP